MDGKIDGTDDKTNAKRKQPSDGAKWRKSWKERPNTESKPKHGSKKMINSVSVHWSGWIENLYFRFCPLIVFNLLYHDVEKHNKLHLRSM